MIKIFVDLQICIAAPLNLRKRVKQILIKSFFHFIIRYFPLAPYLLLEHFKITFNKRFCHIYKRVSNKALMQIRRTTFVIKTRKDQGT